MVKVDVICVKRFILEDIFYLKPFPYGQEPCNLGSWDQKFERVFKGSDFEVVESRPEINIYALYIFEFKYGILDII